MGAGCCQLNTERNQVEPTSHVRRERLGNFSFEIHEDFYVGEGCKRTPAWETNKTPEYVGERRAEFWGTRVEGSDFVWQVLRAAVEEPEHRKVQAELAEQMVESAGIIMPNGLLTETYDSTGVRYDLPPYIINEPFKYGSHDPTQKTSAQANDQLLTLTFRNSNRGDLKMSLSNLSAIADVKAKYLKELSLDGSQVRLFYKGQELRDTSKIADYHVQDLNAVQVLIS